MSGCDMADGTCTKRIVQHHDDYASKTTRPLCGRHHYLWHRENGHAPNWKDRRPKGKVLIAVYLPHAEYVEFRRLCESQDKTMSAVLRRAIREYLAARAATPIP